MFEQLDTDWIHWTLDTVSALYILRLHQPIFIVYYFTVYFATHKELEQFVCFIFNHFVWEILICVKSELLDVRKFHAHHSLSRKLIKNKI